MSRFLAQVLPVDSSAVESANSIVAGMTAPVLTEKNFQIERLLHEWGEAFVNFGIRVVLAILLFLVGGWIIKRLRNLIATILERRQIEGVAISLINSIIVALLYIALGIGIASTLGVQSVSFAAILASMGLAIGMALSGQLQNLAGGVIIVLTKPFSIGNFIEAQGVQGTVRTVTLFHTIITTPENKIIYIPNGGLSNNVIVNFNEATTRRLEWVVGIDYGADTDKALSLLVQLLQHDDRILKTPEPYVAVQALGPSSIDLVVRAWVDREQVLLVSNDFNKAVLDAFNEAGISFPFPQLTISKRIGS